MVWRILAGFGSLAFAKVIRFAFSPAIIRKTIAANNQSKRGVSLLCACNPSIAFVPLSALAKRHLLGELFHQFIVGWRIIRSECWRGEHKAQQGNFGNVSHTYKIVFVDSADNGNKT